MSSDALRIEARARQGQLRCALCHDGLAADAGRTCPACGTTTHAGCADEARGCPTLGCRQRRGPLTARRSDPGAVAAVVAFAALVVPLAGAVGLVLGSLYLGRLVQDVLEDAVCVLTTLGITGAFAGGLAGLVVRAASRRGAAAAWIVAGLLVACPVVGGMALGVFVAVRDRSHDSTGGPFR